VAWAAKKPRLSAGRSAGHEEPVKALSLFAFLPALAALAAV
jgi:hypothetical protein